MPDPKIKPLPDQPRHDDGTKIIHERAEPWPKVNEYPKEKPQPKDPPPKK